MRADATKNTKAKKWTRMANPVPPLGGSGAGGPLRALVERERYPRGFVIVGVGDGSLFDVMPQTNGIGPL